jgi:hypothetical protein
MIMMRFLLAAFLVASTVDAFTPQHTTRALHRQIVMKMASDNDFKDFEGDMSEEYKGSVDWDGEWKKVIENKNQPMERPGKDFYKSEAEIAAIKAANRAQEQLAKTASSIPSVPSFDSLKGDWRVRLLLWCVI